MSPLHFKQFPRISVFSTIFCFSARASGPQAIIMNSWNSTLCHDNKFMLFGQWHTPNTPQLFVPLFHWLAAVAGQSIPGWFEYFTVFRDKTYRQTHKLWTGMLRQHHSTSFLSVFSCRLTLFKCRIFFGFLVILKPDTGVYLEIFTGPSPSPHTRHCRP